MTTKFFFLRFLLLVGIGVASETKVLATSVYQYYVHVASSPTGKGKVYVKETNAQEFKENKTEMLDLLNSINNFEFKYEGDPSTGYFFLGWSKDTPLAQGGDIVSKDNPATISISSSYLLFELTDTPPDPIPFDEEYKQWVYANLTRLQIESENDEAGTAILLGQIQALDGDAVRLKATANSGYRFKEWRNGDDIVSDKNPYSLTVDDGTAGTYTAYFEEQQEETAHEIIIDDSAQGFLSASPKAAKAGETVTLTVTLAEGFVVDDVKYDNEEATQVDGTHYTFTMPNDLVIVSAKMYVLMPTGLTVTAITDVTASLNWVNEGSATSWQLCLNGDEENLITVTEKPYTLTGLTPSTVYSVKVRAVAGNIYSRWSVPVDFKTFPVATVVGTSWRDDFEGSECGWELINGTCTNAWVWGGATHNGGTHALYISSDGGTSNKYNTAYSTKVFAAKFLSFADGKYEISYDWLADGEPDCDFLRVALVPGMQVLTAGTDYSTIGNSDLPNGWIALDGGRELNKSADWQRRDASVDMKAGNYYLVFVWRNDGGTGVLPPAAIDNVSVRRVTCLADVEELSVNDITTAGATLSWNLGDANQWQVAYSSSSTFENATEVIVDNSSYSMTGLEEGTDYYAKVRSFCGEDYGSWSSPVSFTTLEIYPKPTDLAVTAATDVTATLSWKENGSATSWQICLDGDEENLITVTENPYTLTGLSASTDYNVKVRAMGESRNGRWSVPLVFKTTPVGTVIGASWSDDFEGSECGWELINGTCTNAWVWGGPTHGGTHALYISDDGGATNSYNTTNDAKVFAAKLLSFTDGKYEISYDWQANGELNYDFLRVALVPGMQVLTAGTDPRTIGYSDLPNGWIALDGGSQLSTSADWQRRDASVDMKAGNYYLVFVWRNDYSYGDLPPAAIDNVSVRRGPSFADDGTDNAETIAVNDGERVDATLSGRTLWKDGYWNTLCLPFDVDDLTGTPLEGATIKEFDGTASYFSDGTLTLNFTDVVREDSQTPTLKAGKPYLVKWEQAVDTDPNMDVAHIVDPAFTGVILDATENSVSSSDGKVTFKGTYDYILFSETDRSVLYLGSNSTLYYPESGVAIGAFRAYFQLNDGLKADDVNEARLFFGYDGETQGVISLTPDTIPAEAPTHSLSGYYTLDGRKLVGRPTAKGLYIHRGRKVVMK